MHHAARAALLLATIATAARAQNPAARAAEKPGPLQDNSFLIEEAYNQEKGVVQHISTFARARGTGAWEGSFTQEWPAGGLTHQLSVTIPVQRDAGSGAGVGDVLLNYRNQLVGDGESVLAVAPRLSLVLPTGDYKAGRGAGAPGVDAMLPASVAIGESLVAHLNAGVTVIPNARDASGRRATTTDYLLGASAIWLIHPRFNAMVEVVRGSEQAVGGGRSSTVVVSPGVRGAFNFPSASGLQVVPGFAVPITVSPSGGDRALFFYLSLEHAFQRGVQGPGA